MAEEAANSSMFTYHQCDGCDVPDEMFEQCVVIATTRWGESQAITHFCCGT